MKTINLTTPNPISPNLITLNGEGFSQVALRHDLQKARRQADKWEGRRGIERAVIVRFEPKAEVIGTDGVRYGVYAKEEQGSLGRVI